MEANLWKCHVARNREDVPFFHSRYAGVKCIGNRILEYANAISCVEAKTRSSY